MKGIILAGGSGTRLYPLTKALSKQLLAIYDKPMIYYPLSTLMLAGIKDILIISTPQHLNLYKELLGDGLSIGLNISYKVQLKPNGLAEAFILGKNFIGKSNVCLILGDNIFYGSGFSSRLKNCVEFVQKHNKVKILGYRVENPQDFGVVNLDGNKIISIEEKPINPKSDIAVLGLYFYPNSVVDFVNEIKPSQRGELEISSLNELYLEKKMLSLDILKPGITWLDTGTHDSIYEASNFVFSIYKKLNLNIACIEELAFKLKFISNKQFKNLVNKMPNSSYKKYLIKNHIDCTQ